MSCAKLVFLCLVEMAATRSIVANLNQGDKLNDKNYDVWHHKIQYILEEQDMLETISQSMVEPEHGTTAQDMQDMGVYQAYKRTVRVARSLMLSSMRNDMMLCFENNRLAMAVWDAVKIQFGGTSTTRLHQITLKFEAYKKQSNHTIRQHLTVMSNMVRELKGVGQELIDEQQVQVVIRSLPNA